MDNEKTLTPQPELYKCNCCENYSTTRYSLSILTEGFDERVEGGDIWDEFTAGLCRHCYYNWLEGRLSTRELIILCDHNNGFAPGGFIPKWDEGDYETKEECDEPKGPVQISES